MSYLLHLSPLEVTTHTDPLGTLNPVYFFFFLLILQLSTGAVHLCVCLLWWPFSLGGCLLVGPAHECGG